MVARGRIALAEAIEEESSDPATLADAVELYRGDLLDGLDLRGAPLFDEWLLVERERWQLAYLNALWRLAQHPKGKKPSRHGALLAQIRDFIDTHLNKTLTVAELASIGHMSPNYLNHLFSEETGESLHAYLMRKRMEEAMRLCADTDMLIKQVAFHVGYSDPLYFSRAFYKHFGRWPSECRNG